MKYCCPTICLFLVSITIFYGQKNEICLPYTIDPLDYSPQKEKIFLKLLSKCDSLIAAIDTQEKYDNLTAQQLKILNACDLESYNYYDTKQAGCSWYCNGEPDTVLVSSTYPNTRKTIFSIDYLSDFDHYTYWFSNPTDSMPSITYSFEYYSPRVTQISIANGIVSTNKKYKSKARAKEIELLYNNNYLTTLYLQDIRSVQSFDIGVLGNKNTSEDSQEHGNWKLELRIKSYYARKGKKAIAISEISFNGLDSHGI